ncbi:MAG: DNA repair protein RecO [Bacilli bacterium]|jgi:DNA repair protein RecO
MEIIGIVLRLTPFKEKDAMVNILTAERIYSFLARGVLGIASKNLSSVQPFTESRFMINKGKEGLTLRTGTVLHTFEQAKTKLSNLAVLSFVGELTNKVISSEEAAGLYPYLHACLTNLDAGFDPLTTALLYFASVLKTSGYGLEVTKCVISGQRSDISAISFIDGGFVATPFFDPLSHQKCSERKLKIFRQIFLAKPDELNRVTFERRECLEILSELTIYLQDAAGVRLKSIDFLEKVS